MNGSFRHEPLPVFGDRIANIRSWWRRCVSVEAAGMLVTSWEPGRLAIEMTTVVDAAAACLWLDPGLDDAPGMLARGFDRVFGGAAGRGLARDALACDERAFAGYARWEMATAGTPASPGGAYPGSRRSARSSSAWRPGPRGCRALPKEHRVPALPGRARRLRPLGGGGGPRSPSAHGPRGPGRRRRRARHRRPPAARAGVRAGRGRGGPLGAELWRLTRDKRVRGPNEEAVARDAVRLRELRLWLRRCARRPSLLDRLAGLRGMAAPV